MLWTLAALAALTVFVWSLARVWLTVTGQRRR